MHELSSVLWYGLQQRPICDIRYGSGSAGTRYRDLAGNWNGANSTAASPPQTIPGRYRIERPQSVSTEGLLSRGLRSRARSCLVQFAQGLDVIVRCVAWNARARRVLATRAHLRRLLGAETKGQVAPAAIQGIKETSIQCPSLPDSGSQNQWVRLVRATSLGNILGNIF